MTEEKLNYVQGIIFSLTNAFLFHLILSLNLSLEEHYLDGHPYDKSILILRFISYPLSILGIFISAFQKKIKPIKVSLITAYNYLFLLILFLLLFRTLEYTWN